MNLRDENDDDVSKGLVCIVGVLFTLFTALQMAGTLYLKKEITFLICEGNRAQWWPVTVSAYANSAPDFTFEQVMSLLPSLITSGLQADMQRMMKIHRMNHPIRHIFWLEATVWWHPGLQGWTSETTIKADMNEAAAWGRYDKSSIVSKTTIQQIWRMFFWRIYIYLKAWDINKHK